jgi:predicted double-glycine peptidase
MHPTLRRSHPLLYLVALACAGFMLQHRLPVSAGDEATFRDLRYRGTVPQTTDYSCGAAAVACLLQEYFGIPTTEQEILELTKKQMIARGEDPGLTHGLTAYDLKVAAETLGLPMAGYELTHTQLEDYFRRGGLPVIAHVTQPQYHYLVVIGMAVGHTLLSDPAWGRYIAPLRELVDIRGMSGVFLVPLPNAEQVSRVKREQDMALEWMRSRVSQLKHLRESML